MEDSILTELSVNDNRDKEGRSGDVLRVRCKNWELRKHDEKGLIFWSRCQCCFSNCKLVRIKLQEWRVPAAANRSRFRWVITPHNAGWPVRDSGVPTCGLTPIRFWNHRRGTPPTRTRPKCQSLSQLQTPLHQLIVHGISTVAQLGEWYF